MAEKKQAKEKKPKTSLAAHILALIAAVILLVNGILMIVLQNWIIETMKTVGLSADKTLLLTLGIIWAILALIVGVATFRIRATASREWSWFLFVLAAITLLSGRIESGILALLSSIIYIAKGQRKPEMVSRARAIVGLIVNLILPGLGTLIFKRYELGIIQLVCSVIGIAFVFVSVPFFLLGAPLFLAMWIWALVLGIKRIRESK
jgi:hypothetical protein